MHKIDAAGHVNNEFVEEDAATNRPPTYFSAAWFNAVQKEIIAVIEAAGINLNKADNTQLNQALEKKFRLSYMVVQDQKPSGTLGGSPSAGFQTTRRDLNTVVNNTIVGASLNSNVITLPAGVYRIHGFAIVGQVGDAKTSIFNTSSNQIVIAGAGLNVPDTFSTELLSNYTKFDGIVSLSNTTTLDVRTYTAFRGVITGFLNSDFGWPMSIPGQAEIYSQVTIFKIG